MSYKQSSREICLERYIYLVEFLDNELSLNSNSRHESTTDHFLLIKGGGGQHETASNS